MGVTPRLELDTRSADAIDGRQLRAVAFQSVRMEYLGQALDQDGVDPAGSRALVVGSGRGDLARGLARLGMQVVALDSSATATEMARERTEREGLAIVHETAPPEELGDRGEPFDLAYYADTLEVVERLDPGFELAPGGAPIVTYLGRARRS